MAKKSRERQRAIEESLDPGMDEQDRALIEHVFEIEPQGLYRQGWKPGIVEEVFGAPPREELDNVSDYLYPWDDDIYIDGLD